MFDLLGRGALLSTDYVSVGSTIFLEVITELECWPMDVKSDSLMSESDLIHQLDSAVSQ